MSKWPFYPIASLGNVTTGSTPTTSKEHFYGGDIPFVTPGELDQIDPITTAIRTLSKSGSDEARLLPAGTVMVCCIGSLGKVGIAGCTVATNQQINSIAFDPSLILPRFGFYACRRLKSKLKTMAPATTVAIVSKSKFERLEIPVPPLPEQWRITEVLDRAEALRVKRRAALAQVDTLTQSIFLDMFGDPATNPKGWPQAALRELVLEFRYGTSNKSDKDGSPTLRIPNVIGGTIDFSDLKHVPVTSAEFERLRLLGGDLLFVRTNGNPDYVGRCAIFDDLAAKALGFAGNEFAFASYLIRARIKTNLVNPVFLREFVLGTQGRKEMRSRSKTSAGQFNINTESLGAIPIPVPTISLQRDFAREAAAVAAFKTAHRASLAKLDALFASLQHRAFRGEL